GKALNDMNAVFFGIGSREHDDVVKQLADVNLHQAQFHGPGKVHESLNYAIETPDLTANDVDVTFGVAIRVFELLPQHLEVDDDGVDGVFDFVRDAGGQPANRRHAARYL